MADQLVIARYSFSEFGDELINDDYGAWIKYDDHVKALADAERRGMERAAKILDDYAHVCDDATVAVRKYTLHVMADQLRADAVQAQADKEES